MPFLLVGKQMSHKLIRKAYRCYIVYMLEDEINQASGCFTISIVIPKATTIDHKSILVIEKTFWCKPIPIS